ncbi:MAG TPA: tail fiber domain-containing protein, partial [Parafilimonas sp.]|nr:tail fiber domain-containing protein [Parafilimonas sp.]
GNSGTISGTNFIGTTDAQSLMFKVNNQKAGYLDSDSTKGNTTFGYLGLSRISTGKFNTAIGNQALYSNKTGTGNIANGAYTLYSNTTGTGNVAVGRGALYSNTTGNYNTAGGHNALYYNTTGYSNVAIGVRALYSNTVRNNLVAIGDSALYNNGNGVTISYEATENTAIGSKALYSNTAGYNNTASGYRALFSNTTGYDNTANGSSALYNNTDGNYNTATGNYALYNNKTGDYNTATGYEALYYNTGSENTANGYHALWRNTTGRANTANGMFALFHNTTGYQNNAFGERALEENTIGNYNTAIGDYALSNNTTGTGNVALGRNGLYINYTGNENTALGFGADVSTVNLMNATVIGSRAIVDASNKVQVGNDEVTSIGGQVGWTTFSDGRYKKNIKEDVQGLGFINSLRPITYTVDITSLNEYYNQGTKHDSSYEKMKAIMRPSADAASRIVYNGFIAQEVEAAAKKLNYDFSGVDKPQTKDGLYGLRYADFVVPLVKAVQELSAKNDAKDAEINDLKTRLAKLEAMMNVQNTRSNQQAINITSASLQQNVPNPFNHTTAIAYTLPQEYSSAKIVITNKVGAVLKEINLSGYGKGSSQIDATTLSAGAYSYSLYVDGRLIDTRQMVLTK